MSWRERLEQLFGGGGFSRVLLRGAGVLSVESELDIFWISVSISSPIFTHYFNIL